MVEHTYGTPRAQHKYMRLVRTIVIEGPTQWVQDVNDRAFCPAPGVGGLSNNKEKRVLCADSYTEESAEPLDWRERCAPCEGRGYVGPGEGMVSERCEACGGTGKGKR